MVLRVLAGRMVGRDGELRRLLALLDDAEASQSVAALVSGDAGVGKSRLVSEVTRLAEERGFTVLSGQCAELGDSVPYLPLADALRGAAQSTALNDIVTRAEGNAYYAEELLAAWVNGDQAERQSLPAGLAALLLSRVERLSDETQRVLRAAAVAGRKADDELVQAASGLAPAEYD